MTPMAPKKSLGVSPLRVLVVTFLKNSPAVRPLAVAALAAATSACGTDWLCASAGNTKAIAVKPATAAKAPAVTILREQEFIADVSSRLAVGDLLVAPARFQLLVHLEGLALHHTDHQRREPEIVFFGE